MLNREAEIIGHKILKGFKAMAITGPRQSGKTTLAKKLAPDKPYINFENPDERILFQSDPKGYLNRFIHTGAIFDEAQNVPDLFSYLQEYIDLTHQNGHYILTGSNNFSMTEKISESLAGRLVYLELLPLQISEYRNLDNFKLDLSTVIFNGGYPSIIIEKRDQRIWFQSYIRNFIERDIRQIKNIDNLAMFQRFLYLCAARASQQINLSSLGNDTGIDIKTVSSWLGILQASYVIHLVQPYYINFGKRVIKAPKLYFIDTGLLCHLLNINSEQEIFNHAMKGPLFENLIVSELLKNRYNKGLRSNLYYFRDKSGHEVDIIIDNGIELIPIELKASSTYHADFIKGLNYWNKLTHQPKGVLIYGGIQKHTIHELEIVPWYQVGEY